MKAQHREQRPVDRKNARDTRLHTLAQETTEENEAFALAAYIPALRGSHFTFESTAQKVSQRKPTVLQGPFSDHFRTFELRSSPASKKPRWPPPADVLGNPDDICSSYPLQEAMWRSVNKHPKAQSRRRQRKRARDAGSPQKNHRQTHGRFPSHNTDRSTTHHLNVSLEKEVDQP